VKAWIALDQGTTACKAAVFDARGRLLGAGRAAVRTRFGPHGEAWQQPAALESGMRRAIGQAMAAAGHPRLEAAGIASQRSTFVLWDRRTGRPAGPAPTWQSTEAAALCERLAPHAREVRRITGLPLSAHYSASKLARRLRREPSLRRRARRGDVAFGPVSTWLLWRLSGGSAHATDPTLAARTLLFDIGRLAWSPEMLDLFDVPAVMLPEVRPSLGDHGVIRIGGQRVPVRALLGDQQAALAGAMGLEAPPGERGVMVNLGTGAFVLVPTGARLERREGLLSSIAWTRGATRRHLLEGTVNAAGAAIDWMRDLAGATGGLAGLDRLCGRSRAAVHVIPSFWGLGSAFLGARSVPPVIASHARLPWTRADLAAGTVEAVAHATAVCVRLAAPGQAPRRVVATGPLTRLRHLMTTLSAVLNLPVHVPRSTEATLAGIALAASGGAMRPGSARGVTHRATARERDRAAEAHAAWISLAGSVRAWRAPGTRP
jgi:glycerol kinase